MRLRANKNQSGQAMLEAMVALPALILALAIFVLCILIFSLRIHLVFVTQELASCRLSVKSTYACESQAHRQTYQLLEHWGFHEISVMPKSGVPRSSMRIRATWGQNPWKWTLRWTFEENIPFQFPK